MSDVRPIAMHLNSRHRKQSSTKKKDILWTGESGPARGLHRPAEAACTVLGRLYTNRDFLLPATEATTWRGILQFSKRHEQLLRVREVFRPSHTLYWPQAAPQKDSPKSAFFDIFGTEIPHKHWQSHSFRHRPFLLFGFKMVLHHQSPAVLS